MLRDLTKGNTFKTLLLFFLPIYIGNLFQTLYGMVDAFIVGRTVSSDALTGVTATGSITFFVTGFAVGLTAGFGVKTGQYKGAGNEEMVRKSIAVSFELTMIFTVILTAITVPLAGPCLKWMQTPPQYYEYAYPYLVTIFAGLVATMLYNVTCGSLRAVGDSRAPLVFLIISAFLNVFFDLIFVIAFKMVYTGVAVATVVSSLLSGLASLIYMFKAHPQLIPKKEHWIPDLKLWWSHISVGLPMSFQYIITATGLIVQQTALNGLDARMPGTATSYAVGARVVNIFETAFASMGVAAATFTAQNYGAKQYGRIRDGVFAGLVYSGIWCVISVLFISLAGEPMVTLFIDKNTGDALLYFNEMIKYSKQYMITQALAFPFVILIYLLRNVVQGMGKSAITVVGGVLELIGRSIASILLVEIWDFTGTCFSHPLAWVFASIFFVIIYAVIIRKFDTSDAKYRLKNLFRKNKVVE